MHDDAAQPSILIVDDTIENLRLLSGMLSTRGFDVRPVTSGQEALRAVASEPPDLILLDVSMPDMNGFEVCTRVKEDAAWRDIPVIFLTALTDAADKVRGFDVGGADYIAKPFQIEEVLARVAHQLALRQAHRELAESLARLQELERLRDDLVHMVVHDMRSPLMALLMHLDAAFPKASGEVARLLESALHSAEAVNRMAESLLDVSRLEQGKMPLERAPCDLARLADDVRTAVAPMDVRRAIDLEAPERATVSCDHGLIRRVIENLLINGIKHTPGGGRLRIVVAALPGRARVAVQDEGEGVPESARARIFEKFGTVAARKNQAYHSAGLGLAFCKLAVEAHGGRIGVEPARPHGSIFWFEVPTG